MRLAERKGPGMIEINTQHKINSVTFTEDGRQVVGGGKECVLRRWGVDGQEIGQPIQTGGAEIFAVALSPDYKWLVCGARPSAGNVMVWSVQTQEKVLDVEGHKRSVYSVDVSPDSSKFATGSADQRAFIWNMATGERLVGPLEHDDVVMAVRFSPIGDRIATASPKFETNARSIRIYDSRNGRQLLDILFPFIRLISSPLTWSADGRQIFAVSSDNEVNCFDTALGILVSKWPVPAGPHTSIALAFNQKFAVIVTDKSLSFWDTTTRTQIGGIVKRTSQVSSISLSPNDDCIVVGEGNGRVVLRSLRDILPCSYLTVNFIAYPFVSSYLSQLPLICISHLVFESWTQGDLPRAVELLSEDITHPSSSFHHARALAHRALVRTRLSQWNMAIDDAKESIKIQRSSIGQVAYSIALAGGGQTESAMRTFDLVFRDGLPSGNQFFLLIKAIVLFQCGKHENAVSRIDRLIDIVNDKPSHTAVKAYIQFQLGTMLMQRAGERAMGLFKQAQEAIPVRQSPPLTVVSLMFGWNFDSLCTEIQLNMFKVTYTKIERTLISGVTVGWDLDDDIQKSITTIDVSGDLLLRPEDPKQAIERYSTALTLNQSKRMDLLVKRSATKGMLHMWEDALTDADEAIKLDPLSPWAYETKHAALHGLGRYDEALATFTEMLYCIEHSDKQGIRQLGKKYILPSQVEEVIENAVNGISKRSPLVLIDVDRGRLCDGPQRMHMFKSGLEFKELRSSMTKKLNGSRIQQVVEEYFRYVTLSHVWEGKEPSFLEVNQATSVWELNSSPLTEKLHKFCQEVRKDGYRWAWSDTCCIDKPNSSVLSESLKSMYKWYQASAATFVLLADVPSSSTVGGLTGSKWMTRAWTSQELLAPKVIRFYTRGWEPYLGDTGANHKESPKIIQELVDAIGIARQTIITFNPNNLTVREKLRLASTREATREEDLAYSLIGIFQSYIHPGYGEGDAALGRLLEEIVARHEVTVLDWAGKSSSSYNSCVPSTLAVYSHPHGPLPAMNDAEIDKHVAALRARDSLSKTGVIHIHRQVNRLPPVSFSQSRLRLPCIIFAVKSLRPQDSSSSSETCYKAIVSGIGDVEFQTLDDELSKQLDRQKLIFVHPWIHDLLDPSDSFTEGNHTSDDELGAGTESGFMATSSTVRRLSATTVDDYTRALRLVARLQQPFHALLLRQQSKTLYKRVATDRKITIKGIDCSINFTTDVHVNVVHIQ